MPHFNQLEPAEAEALAILSEECGEVVQAIGKILRHGLHMRWPAIGETNLEKLQAELGHVAAAVALLQRLGLATPARIESAAHEKLRTVGRWLHHIEPPEAA